MRAPLACSHACTHACSQAGSRAPPPVVQAGVSSHALATGVLEAFAHGLTAVAILGPGTRLHAVRVPRGGGLLVVAPPEALPPAMAMWPTLDPRR